MSEPFLAEIRIVGFNFAPRGWAFCDGQILPINQNQSLYSLLGTTYGGDGRTSFALPDLRGRTPCHPGTESSHTVQQGQKAGEETHVLSAAETPAHQHRLRGQAGADATITGGSASAVFAKTVSPAYTPDNPASHQNFNPRVISSVGEGQGHENMQPYLAVNFCIALRGLFPSRN